MSWSSTSYNYHLLDDDDRFSVRKYPEYPKILSMPKERKGTIFLDIGTGCTLKEIA